MDPERAAVSLHAQLDDPERLRRAGQHASRARRAVGQREDQHDDDELRVLVPAGHGARVAGAIPQLRHEQQDGDLRAHRCRRQRSGSQLGRRRRPVTEAPYGWNTANPYGSTTARFDAQASYDIKSLTIEGTYHDTQFDRTYREATKGAENGWTASAILHHNNWLLFRGTYDSNHRTASGYDPALSIGLQADESERNSTRAGLDVELTPANGKVTFMVAYFHHNDDYPNRPNRTAGVEGTTNGLLNAQYDTYTVEADWNPIARAGLGFYYTYEKDLLDDPDRRNDDDGGGAARVHADVRRIEQRRHVRLQHAVCVVARQVDVLLRRPAARRSTA